MLKLGLAGLSLADLLRADEARLPDASYRKKSIINVYLGGKYAAAFDTEMCGFAAANVALRRVFRA